MAKRWLKAEVLSMDFTDENTSETLFRILLNGTQVKYITVGPGTYDYDVLVYDFALDLLAQVPNLPVGEWTQAYISRPADSGAISFELSNAPLAGLHAWHPNVVDILSLTLYGRISPHVRMVTYDRSTHPVIAKIARFEFELPKAERESAAYRAIEGHAIGPAFLGHIGEHGRVIGLLVEKVEGRPADISDLEACQDAVKRLHALGIAHGDLNRYNFIVSPSGVTLIDFENSTLNGSPEAMRLEYDRLADELTEDTGRGAKSWDDISTSSE